MKMWISALMMSVGLFTTAFAVDEVPAVLQVHSGNFDMLIKSHEGIIIDVYADWCGPCKMMEPYFAQAFELLKDQCQFAQINADVCYSLCGQLKVRSLPTLLFFKDGKEVGRVIGYHTYEQLMGYIQTYLKITPNSGSASDSTPDGAYDLSS